MKLIATIAAASVSLLMLSTGANAQSKYVADKQIDAVNLADVTAIATSLGHTSSPVPEKNDMVLMQGENVFKYVLQPKVCKQEGVQQCKGILVFAVINDLTFVNDSQIHDINNRFQPVKVYRAKGGQNVIFSRYLILDRGVTMANIRDNISVFLATSRNMVQAFKENSGS
jgi:hypothetical protein